ncbi:MAG TPA: uroporphyrinogen-III C-methyltransferase [Usitatibacter sp.]|nr:uroporphyrinogen-III C-methyltransferase [Usitatibacter sp.]
MGKVYLVGAGPGAPDLLTLRAARVLAQADIVLHDALVHPGTLELAVKARFIDVGKRYGKVSTEQRFIHRALIEAARTHDVVVRLKGGDPMMFGRAQEELDALAAAGIETEVVPGVTAALAAASMLRVSLTRRGIARSVVFLTPRVGRGESSGTDHNSMPDVVCPPWLPAALAADTAVLYMAAGASREIARALIEAGKPPSTPVALVESATLPAERRTLTTLAALAVNTAARAEGPVVVCVGEVFRDAAHALQIDPLTPAAWNEHDRQVHR